MNVMAMQRWQKVINSKTNDKIKIEIEMIRCATIR